MPDLSIPYLRGAQRKIAAHPARFKVVACGRRWGKTTLGSVMAVKHALQGHRVWWVAPTFSLAFHPWLAFQQRFADEWESKNEYYHHIELKNGGSITVKSTDRPFTLRGVGVDFLVIDEAAFIEEIVWTQILRPALSDTEGSALLISTPFGRNWFAHAFQRGQDREVPDWQSWRAPTSANPSISPQEIADARALLPEHHFRQEYEAEFLEDSGSVFRFIRRAADAPPEPAHDPDHQYVMGIDFARYQDFTACVVIDATTKTMVALDRFSGDTWALQRERIIRLAKKWDCWHILAEANAMGEPNIEALYRAGLPIKRFYTTAQSKAPLIEGLVLAVEEGEISLLPDPVLLGELEAYTYRLSSRGHTLYHAPSGRHDDTVMALALAWKAASRRPLAFTTAVVPFGGGDYGWWDLDWG